MRHPLNANASRRRHGAPYSMNKIERRPAIGARSVASLPASAFTFSEPGACWICSALIGRLGPVDIHDLACWPKPVF